MNKYFFYRKLFTIICLFVTVVLAAIITTSFSTVNRDVQKKGTLKIIFTNTANGKNVVLRDSSYNNFFGEQYNINKLKYYISNLKFKGTAEVKEHKRDIYYLVNAAADENAFEVELQPGTYDHLKFLLGVDSIRNCSGAQSGALDPVNDMFWTWNSGYVMFKLEGVSPASTADLQRIEHHIGGYKGTNNVATEISLDLKSLEIKPGAVTELVIEANLDNYWHSTADIKISELPICVITGDLAKKIASNFNKLFSVKSISNIP
jgi:hypothetical protein